jgi:hypothetical protein
MTSAPEFNQSDHDTDNLDPAAHTSEEGYQMSFGTSLAEIMRSGQSRCLGTYPMSDVSRWFRDDSIRPRNPVVPSPVTSIRTPTCSRLTCDPHEFSVISLVVYRAEDNRFPSCAARMPYRRNENGRFPPGSLRIADQLNTFDLIACIASSSPICHSIGTDQEKNYH